MEGQQKYLTGTVEFMQSLSLTETLLLPRSSSDDQQLLSVRAVLEEPPVAVLALTEEGTHSQDAISKFGPSSDIVTY